MVFSRVECSGPTREESSKALGAEVLSGLFSLWQDLHHSHAQGRSLATSSLELRYFKHHHTIGDRSSPSRRNWWNMIHTVMDLEGSRWDCRYTFQHTEKKGPSELQKSLSRSQCELQTDLDLKISISVGVLVERVHQRLPQSFTWVYHSTGLDYKLIPQRICSCNFCWNDYIIKIEKIISCIFSEFSIVSFFRFQKRSSHLISQNSSPYARHVSLDGMSAHQPIKVLEPDQNVGVRQ